MTNFILLKEWIMEAGVIFIECDEAKQKLITQNYRGIAKAIGADNMICIFKSKKCLAGYIQSDPPPAFVIVSCNGSETLSCFTEEAFASAPLIIYDKLQNTDHLHTDAIIKQLGYKTKWFDKNKLYNLFGLDNNYPVPSLFKEKAPL